MPEFRGDNRDEVIVASEWADVVWGGGGNDRLFGGAGDDVLWGGPGDDFFDGGPGSDTILYAEARRSVAIDLARGVVSFPGQRAPDEFFISIENVETGGGNDTIRGNGAANLLIAGAGADRVWGGAGNDVIRGGPGADVLNGGAGRDLLDLSDLGPVVASLAAGTVRTGGPRAETDRVTGFEDVLGGTGADTIVGDARANRLAGGDGNDVVIGGAGNDVLSGGTFERLVFEYDQWFDPETSPFRDDGADVLDGGAGIDTVVLHNHVAYDLYQGSYDPLNPGAVVDLRNGTISYGGLAAQDRLISIENVTATAADDTIYGNGAANVIRVGDGRNLVIAGGGNDVIHGGTWARTSEDGHEYPRMETLRGGAGDDTIYSNGAIGFYVEFSEEHRTWTDYLDGGPGTDRLHAGVGSNIMSGGGGADEFHFDGEQRLLWNRWADEYRQAWQATEQATILDYRPNEGDRLIIALHDMYGAAEIRYGGEKPREYKDWREEATAEDHFELTWEREGADAVISMQVPDLDDDWYHGPYMTIRLADYAAPLTEADFVFV